MHNSTKEFVKWSILKLMEQCGISINDIIDVVNELEGDIERNMITKIAHDASKQAIKETFEHGLPITTLENDKIVYKWKDGHSDIIKSYK